jgi:uncharacterized protein involved in exopolysaccharide biosynthesis
MQEFDIDDPEKDDDEKETTLFDLFLALWRYKKLILIITLCAMVGVVVVSVVSLVLPPDESFLPNLYTPRANMLINNTSSQGGGIAAAINASGLGGLASMAGVNVSGGPTFSSLAIYLVYSDTMLDSVVERFDLVARYKIEKYVIASSRKALKKHLKAEYDDASGAFSISFSDYDPQFACDVVNYCVEYLSRWFDILGLNKNLQQKENLERNIADAYESIRELEREIQNLERSTTVLYNSPVPNVTMETRRINMELGAQQQIYTQLKVQLELTNTAIASETPVFQLIETAKIPDMKSGPSRGRLCIFVSLGAFLFSLLIVFVLTQIEKIKQDSEAMEKLRALNKGRGKK